MLRRSRNPAPAGLSETKSRPQSGKKILVLGAGMVAKPLVRYLLDHNFQVKVATRTVSKAEKILDGHPKGIAEQLDVEAKPKSRLGGIGNVSKVEKLDKRKIF